MMGGKRSVGVPVGVGTVNSEWRMEGTGAKGVALFLPTHCERLFHSALSRWEWGWGVSQQFGALPALAEEPT